MHLGFTFVQQLRIVDLNDILQAGSSLNCNNFLDELDPDTNVTNVLYNNECKYYNEDSFNELLRSEPNIIDSLSLLHVNIRSVPKNLSELQNYMECLNTNFSIVGLSETWLNENNSDMYQIEGYESVSKFRTERRGGGVSLYVRRGVEFKRRSDFELIKDENECIFIEINGHSVGQVQDIILGLMYRPQNTDFDGRL